MLSTLVLVCLWLVRGGCEEVVVTAQGAVRGVRHDHHVSYTGIPYATITEGGTFKKAGIAPVWAGVREPTSTSCTVTSPAQECLTLDVHVPAGGRPGGAGGWPVLVWVRGNAAAAPLRPNSMVRQGVILVIVSHRMGPVGFLCLKEEAIPGNAAAKDVVLALRWVRDNIAAFRGNPSRVVAGAQGAGAALLEGALLAGGGGLMHGAILHSGTLLSPWAFTHDAEDRATILATLLTDSEDDVSSILLNTPIADLVSKSYKLNKPYFPFGLCVEKRLKKEESLISEPPLNLLSRKRVNAVPLIIGFNSDEAYVFASNIKAARALRRLASDVSFLLPEELRALSEGDVAQIARRIRDIYFKSKNNMTMAAVLAFHRDAYFVSHVYRSALLHAAASPQPVHLYQFSHAGEPGVAPEPGALKTGAAHSDELAYLFSTTDMDGEDGTVQRNIVKLWTNFAKYLTPTPVSASGEGSTWPRLEPHSPRLLDIGPTLQVKPVPYAREMTAWHEIYDKYHNNIQAT